MTSYITYLIYFMLHTRIKEAVNNGNVKFEYNFKYLHNISFSITSLFLQHNHNCLLDKIVLNHW